MSWDKEGGGVTKWVQRACADHVSPVGEKILWFFTACCISQEVGLIYFTCRSYNPEFQK